MKSSVMFDESKIFFTGDALVSDQEEDDPLLERDKSMFIFDTADNETEFRRMLDHMDWPSWAMSTNRESETSTVEAFLEERRQEERQKQ